MKSQGFKLSILIMTVSTAGFVTACSPELGTMSNNKTPVKSASPAPTIAVAKGAQQEDSAQLTLGNNLKNYFDNSLPQIPTSEQDAKDLAQSAEALTAAQKNNFKDLTSDGDPEDAFSQPSAFAGLLPEKMPLPYVPTQPAKPISPTPSPTAPPDISPMTLLKNLMCERLGTQGCIAGLQNPVDQSVNYYAFFKGLGMGRLINATLLPTDGVGFHVKSNSQARRYGSKHTIQFIQKLAEKTFNDQITDELVIGDISQRTGGFLGQVVGDQVIGHKSHQNGLDIDIGFIGKDGNQTPHDQFPGDFVAAGKLDTSKFDIEKNWQLVQTAVNSNWTYFILAHPSIKKAFCEKAKATGEVEKYKKVLSQIYPDTTHFNHFHMRLKCPETSPRCVPAAVRPEESGC